MKKAVPFLDYFYIFFFEKLNEYKKNSISKIKIKEVKNFEFMVQRLINF